MPLTPKNRKEEWLEGLVEHSTTLTPKNRPEEWMLGLIEGSTTLTPKNRCEEWTKEIIDASGGGGGEMGTLLATLDMGTISTSSTSETDTGKSISVPDAGGYDILLVVTSCTKTNNKHLGTARTIYLYNNTDATNRTSLFLSSYTLNWKISNNIGQSRCGTTPYGIYPYSCTISDGTATIPMYERYNSTSTGQINGDYTAKVYGINIYAAIESN